MIKKERSGNKNRYISEKSQQLHEICRYSLVIEFYIRGPDVFAGNSDGCDVIVICRVPGQVHVRPALQYVI